MAMYNLLEYSSNYSDTTGSLWFYYKDEATNFDADNTGANNFKTFNNYMANLLGNTEADGNNETWKSLIIAVPLNILSNFWRSFEMALINC